jgi:hypothetical protein
VSNVATEPLRLERRCGCGSRIPVRITLDLVKLLQLGLAELRQRPAPDLVLGTYRCPRCRQVVEVRLVDAGLARPDEN